MYDTSDTIVAVSSPGSGKRVIIRIAGPQTLQIVKQIFCGPVGDKNGVTLGTVQVDGELRIGAELYMFFAPASYSGDCLAELCIHTNAAVTEAIVRRLFALGARAAERGEFTARAYLNGKIDLAQAEAVAAVVAAGNRLQLEAAEKMLSGQLAQTTEEIREELTDCLSLIEAGLDFSSEDIELITAAQAVERLERIKSRLTQLLDGSVVCEMVAEMASVAIAGSANAGKSSLLNSLLRQDRSIVSQISGTTRDILTGVLQLEHCQVVLFDCAGLAASEPAAIIDKLAQQAAVEAIGNAEAVVFCVDISKQDYSEDAAVRDFLKTAELIAAATKADLLSDNEMAERLGRLKKLFGLDFLAVSSRTGEGLMQLKGRIDKVIIGSGQPSLWPEGLSAAALTARHKQALTGAVENIGDSIEQIKGGSEEVAAMMLRGACRLLSTIERQDIDEQVLGRIFERFCIGK